MDTQELTTRDDFEHWLASMDDFLEQFIAQFPREDQFRLDYSPSSLDIVEAWILKTYADTDAMLAKSESQAVNRAACYVGETYRKNRGGKWDIRLNDTSFVFNGVPILTDPQSTIPHCPLTLVTATADRRTGSYLRTVLENS